MYNKITNPLTGRKANIDSKLGKKILAYYIYQSGGANLCSFNEKTGKCNIISRYGETFKTDNDLYHCWFYKCQDPSNLTWIQQTAWGNGASTSNSYILPILNFTLCDPD